MTPAHVHQRIIAIGSAAKRGDHEQAHRLEQALFYEALRAIGSGAGNPEQLAQLALRSTELNFTRNWETERV